MASRTVSPGGALLRSSRLFSLPRQIPPPAVDATGFMVHSSPSATTAFPTLQTVASPQSSRSRGDWGFKRALPNKLVSKSSNPVIRVQHVDSPEQFTDYAMASDHLLQLRKWQEMRVPITVRPSGSDRVGKSVFEEQSDSTVMMEPGAKSTLDVGRWKFKGPWLSGMDRGAFERYVKNQVRGRRSEFIQFLRGHLAVEITSVAQSQAMDAGTTPAAITADDITDDQVFEYLRKQTRGRTPTSLYHLVEKFLDLAPVSLALNATRKANPYAKEGPPMTHPSAGLSYLRTGAYLDNHPIYGPQRYHPPVEARVLAPRGFRAAKIGVGGFVADSPGGEASYNIKAPGSNAQEGLDPNVRGGTKRYVHPKAATINARGGIELTVEVGDDEATLVKRELDGQSRLFNNGSESLTPLRVGMRSPLRRMLRNRQYTPGAYVPGNSQTYGIEI